MLSVEALVGILDLGTWLGTQPPRVGYRYRVRRPIDATGHVLPTSGDITSFMAHLAPDAVIRVVKEPARDRTAVDV